jgi:hypothetical protein
VGELPSSLLEAQGQSLRQIAVLRQEVEDQRLVIARLRRQLEEEEQR